MVTKRADTTVRRRQIVSAARKLIAKYGSEHLTVRKIAKEIGVSEGAIYRHFKSKREILSFLVDEIEKLLISDIEQNSQAIGVNTLDILSKIIHSHISAVERRSGMSFQIIAEIISLGDRKLNKKIYDVIDRYIAGIKDVLSSGTKAGAIREGLDLEGAATLFFSLVQGLISIWALEHYDFNLEQRFNSLWGVYRAAISPQ